MISAFYKNKHSLNRCEDTLTAAVFDLLKYLPYDLFWKIIKSSLYHQKLPSECGEIEEIVFWDHWDPTDTPNSRHVEPDVFIRTRDFDLIIEAKRYDEKQQGRGQIQNEIQAYLNEYEEGNKKLYFIQLGGLHNLNDEVDEEVAGVRVPILKTDWTKLLYSISSERKVISQINYPQMNAYKRIFDDIILVLEIHGFYNINWLNTLNSKRRNIGNNFNFYEYARQ